MINTVNPHVLKLILKEQSDSARAYLEHTKEICDQYHDGVVDPSKMEVRRGARKKKVYKP